MGTRNDGPPLIVRDLTYDDVAFISATWKKSYRSLNPVLSICPPKIFFYWANKAVDEMILRSSVKVACDKTTTDQILGWICFDSVAIHYVYVKGAYRHLGIAKTLVGCTPHRDAKHIRVTHWTKDAESYADKERRLVYLPSLAFVARNTTADAPADNKDHKPTEDNP